MNIVRGDISGLFPLAEEWFRPKERSDVVRRQIGKRSFPLISFGCEEWLSGVEENPARRRCGNDGVQYGMG